jgi:DeoR/GlpR family transcriptional regulator of sugar metabolism
MFQHSQKLAIASCAAKMVKPGMTIVIDSGTTCWHFASQLKLRKKAPLRIITSALAVIETLGSIKDIEINLVGGRFRIGNLDFCGPLSSATFANFHADIAFLSCDSLLPQTGAFTQDIDSAAISHGIANCAEKRILLCDHTKLGKSCCHRILAPREIDYVITDMPDDSFNEVSYKVILAN